MPMRSMAPDQLKTAGIFAQTVERGSDVADRRAPPAFDDKAVRHRRIFAGGPPTIREAATCYASF